MRLKKNRIFDSKMWKMNYFNKNDSTLLFNQQNEETKQQDITYVTSNCFSAWPSKLKVSKQLFLK
jgi:hypothetical protein